MLDNINAQFNKERSNHAIYRAMADALDNLNWPGSSKWMRHASDEEQEHAEKFAEYLVARGVQPIYADLPAPVIPSGDNLPAYFQAALDLENANTESIKALQWQAENDGDYQTEVFLIWAIEEQTRSVRELVDITLELARVDATGYLILDARYGS